MLHDDVKAEDGEDSSDRCGEQDDDKVSDLHSQVVLEGAEAEEVHHVTETAMLLIEGDQRALPCSQCIANGDETSDHDLQDLRHNRVSVGWFFAFFTFLEFGNVVLTN